MNGLVLHCGANRAELQQVAEVRTPEPTKTWFPIPHLSLINRVREALTALNMRVVEEAHALAKGGDRYFGLLRVANGRVTSDDFGYVLGLRDGCREFPVVGIDGVHGGCPEDFRSVL